MGLFENFPFTNFHELNLDWVIQTIKKLSNSYEELKETIDKKLDDWLTDGTIENIINDKILPNVTRYMDDISSTLIAHGIRPCSVAVKTVGQGRQYSSFVDAVHSCSPEKPTVLLVYPGMYSTYPAIHDNDGYGLTLDNIFVVGMGNRAEVQIVCTGVDPASTLCLKNNAALYNVFVTGKNQRYTIHDDFHNRRSDVPQFRRVVDCEIYGINCAQAYGSGIKSNQDVLIKNTYIYGFDCDAFRMHNFTGTDDYSTLRLENCTFVSGGKYKMDVILGCLNEGSGSKIFNTVRVIINGGNITSVQFISEPNGNVKAMPFILFSDRPLRIKDETTTWRPAGNYIEGTRLRPIVAAAAPAAGNLVIVGEPGESVQKLTTGDVSIAAEGLCLTNPYDNKCLIMTHGIIHKSFIPGLSAGTFNKITVSAQGGLEANGTGRCVGYQDVQGYVHLNFKSY